MSFNKTAVDIIMERLHIQPVGNGYIDMICPVQSIGEFIDCMDELGITIKGFTNILTVKNIRNAMCRRFGLILLNKLGNYRKS